ncbi:hypothetical protein BBR47_35050 [Brevibacillus brevis NBRC 100599]|uniref:Uncharacterized protein n=1 Tax=Brevibacillus brevis (strain 47 / JCM 6285 / NBRC 100599) TaxID=358681 RepID=C0ZFC3_BREBN|nr:hypothetical protein BBR47_35050 [Brevibacillus brevis NBRC 100599]
MPIESHPNHIRILHMGAIEQKAYHKEVLNQDS